MYCFGVDLGGTSVKMGLFQFDGTLIEKWEITTRVGGGDHILPDIAQSIREKIAEKSLKKQEVLGVGIGVPAPVTKEGFVEKSANLGWAHKNVKHELEALLEMDVMVANDANVAALGEMWKGGGAGHRNLVMITLGTGVGGGLIFHGNIVAGSNGAAGEIGHLTVNINEPEQCGCGRHGCLEQYASATGVVKLAKQHLANNTAPTVLQADTLSAKHVFDAAQQQDAVAQKIAQEFGDYLGAAMANIATLLDPDVFVIGGGVSKAGEALLGYISAPYQQYAFFANLDAKITLAQLGNDAGICGAAKLILS